MSTLKHTIRHQQAQLHNLENTILRGPRPLPPGMLNSAPFSTDDFELSLPPPRSGPSPKPPPPSPYNKMQRRTSYEVLQGLAGPDSSLPLPKRDSATPAFGDENGIREGIPIGSPANKRAQSPTRTLSRIPVSSVGNARALAEENSEHVISPQSLSLSASSSSYPTATSPSRRSSFAPGNTTKVLADLQAGVLNAKNALENTKGQLRLSQRQVSQLTRQTEDLKEVRERLRLENEGLNNVVARKERLLQEVLERARKAETEVVALKSQLKSETGSSKKALREMESALTESTARSQKSEREYITLRDSLKGLVETFKLDAESLREEMRKREELVAKEAEEMSKKYQLLVEEVKRERAAEQEVRRLKEEGANVRNELEEGFREEIERLKEEVERSSKESDEAAKTAKHLADELARLRRLMRNAGASTIVPDSTPQPNTHA